MKKESKLCKFQGRMQRSIQTEGGTISCTLPPLDAYPKPKNTEIEKITLKFNKNKDKK